MPMAIFESSRGQEALSPYGASYGGPIFTHALKHSEATAVVSALINYLHKTEINSLKLTVPIYPCYPDYSDAFPYALLTHGFQVAQSEVSSVVPLGGSQSLSTTFNPQTRKNIRKAMDNGIRTSESDDSECFYNLLEETMSGHAATPTHSREELFNLKQRFPDRIKFIIAWQENKPIAGICQFRVCQNLSVSFYLCQSEQHKHLQGLSFIIEKALEKSREIGIRWYDLGTSTNLSVPRDSVFRFKESFGARAYFRRSYRWQNK